MSSFALCPLLLNEMSLKKKTETVIRKQSIFIKIKEVTLTSNIVAIGRKHLALTEIGRSKNGKCMALYGLESSFLQT